MPGPELARDETTWTAAFPGLGSVSVGADGDIAVRAAGPDDDGLRASALRHGWGDLLSWARRGFTLANAASLADGARGLLITGEPDEVAAALLGLARHGFRIVSDRPAPTRWVDQDLIAFPRQAPILVPRRRADLAGLSNSPVRPGSTSVSVDLPRVLEQVRVAAIAHVVRQRPDEVALDALAGTRRFERAATLMLRGVLAADGVDDAAASPEQVFDAHLRLAALPSVVIRMEGRDDESAVERLLDWWRTAVDSA